MVVINVRIRTMAECDIDVGYVRCSGGVFTDIGAMPEYAEVPGEEVIDGTGLTLYPGFIDAHCHIGMWNDALCFEGEDGNEDTDPSTPHLRAIDSVNPMDRCFEDAVSAGVTSVCTGVGSANPIGGSFIIMKTRGSKRIDKLIVKSPAAIKFALGENPKNTYNDRDETPVTRMATAAIIREQLTKAKRYSEDIAEYERLKGTDDEISRVKSAQRTVTSLENKLCGMNLSAAVKMLGGNSLEVTSVRTGEKLDITGERFALTEAVNIRIPGVMEMQLSPADVDIDEVSAKIAAQQEMIHEIFERYSVSDIAGLEQLAKKIAAARTAAESAEMRLAALLGKTDYAGLESAAGDISGEPRPLEEIEAKIRTVCGTSDAARFITARETTVSAYAAEYGSISGLKAKAFDLSTELDKAKEAAESVSDIPEEYLGIADPESHLAALQGGAQATKTLREEALTARTAAVSRLQSLTEDNSGDPAAAAEEAERAFEEQKSLLAHWQHIYEVFTARKEQLHSEPMKDISDSFAQYLSVITGGKVSSEFPDSERLNVNIYSDNRLMDHARLSEGTKETVSLAFRLAVLDHLFPEGGGVIVLDDPFTEMDAERAAQSCELLKACATRHQVIFLTCHEKYIGMLNSEPIRV